MADNTGIRVIYDGDCPVCTQYVQYMRLKESVGTVSLLNAREHPEVVEQLLVAGFNLDDGFVGEYAGKTYYGPDCLHLLALLSTNSGCFNRINALIFRNPTATRLLYPILRLGRNTLLRILGRTKING